VPVLDLCQFAAKVGQPLLHEEQPLLMEEALLTSLGVVGLLQRAHHHGQQVAMHLGDPT